MIVYILNNNYFHKVTLPTKVSGVYPIYAQDKRFLANIEEISGVWKLTLGKNIVFASDEVTNVELYSNWIFKDITTGEIFFAYTMPIYDENAQRFLATTSEITIGKFKDKDIYYQKEDIPEAEIKLVYTKAGKWHLTTELENVFVSGFRTKDRMLFNGDYIFYYGLKIIVIDRLFIISNPNNLVTVKPTSFSAYKPLEEEKNLDVYVPTIPEDTPLYSKNDYYFKAPRFDFVMVEEHVQIDEPPPPFETDDTPVILTIGPQLTMVCTSVITLINYVTMYLNGTTTKTRFLISMSTIVITIIGAMLWPNVTRWFNKRRTRKKEAERKQKYLAYLEKKQHEIELIQNKQKQVLYENSFSAEQCKIIIDSKSRNLWQRTIENSDFLQVRVGIGDAPAKIIINSPEEHFSLDDEDEMLSALKHVVKKSLVIKEVPLSVNLVKNNITAVVGNDALTYPFMESLFLQIMTLHSYTELKIIIFTNDKHKFDYLKILPHCWDNQKTIRYFATNTEEMSTISAELEKVFDERKVNSENQLIEDNGSEEDKNALYKKFRTYYLVFTDDIMTTRNIGIIKKILNYRKNIGFSLLILNDRLSTLPSATSEFINIDEPKSGLITNELYTENQNQFVADINRTIDVYEQAQTLANIPIAVEKAKYELPSSLSFLEMYEVGKVEQLNSSERWRSNNPVNSLAVPVGIDQNGELFKMDIHEKAYGPHGLIAGTTGSGKSEWIVTYILSLAVNFHPDEVQFVLIDYKGGGLAMSFENSELGIKLPHLAGTITNLDKSEINRSIASIESELKRRQAVFNEAREKLKEGSMNIYKYQQFYRKGMVNEPMSHLLIISDEFAELKQQQPEFMEQLISTSRIGRSLGVHLILATQKPSGVVNDQIWSNSKFKVCLKVQDKGDSNEILKKPDAAYLRQTGAFYLSVGNDDYYNLGQSAWAGAKYFPSDILRKKIDQSVQYIDNIGKTISDYDLMDELEANKVSQGEELLNIVQYIDNISKKEIVLGRQLWLPNVASESYLSDLVKKYKHQYVGYDLNVPIGEYDEPRRQEQGLLKIDLAKGNVGIIGQVGSGKEMLISTILWSSMIEHTPYEINYYIIDFGAETMKKFAKFPHVGEVVFQDEIDKVAGILDLVVEELERRKELFQDYNGSYEFYNRTTDRKLPIITVVINGYDVFQEALPKLVDYITNLFRDAPRYGITFIVSVSTQTALRTRQLQYFNHIIMMQMQDDSSYRNVTNCRRGLIPGKYIGRGICKTGDDEDSYCEFQTAKIISEDKELGYLKATADKLLEYYKVKAKQLAKVPDNVTSEDLAKYVTTLGDVPIGYNFYEKDIAKYDFGSEKLHLIACKNIKNNQSFLYGLASILSKIPNVKVRVVDLMGIFNKPILDIKYFNEEFDSIVAALENDVLTRTDTQDHGVNIILGAGQFKSKLSKGGQEIFRNLFDNLPASKKNIFILIDDYEKLRTLKLEPWYSQVNTTSGLWIGSGFSSQSMFDSNEATAEDKKYEFAGLAYSVKDAKYTVIKTLMDGDD